MLNGLIIICQKGVSTRAESKFVSIWVCLDKDIKIMTDNNNKCTCAHFTKNNCCILNFNLQMAMPITRNFRGELRIRIINS